MRVVETENCYEFAKDGLTKEDIDWDDGKDEITVDEWINLEDRTLLQREDLELPKCILDLSRETIQKKNDIHTATTAPSV